MKRCLTLGSWLGLVLVLLAAACQPAGTSNAALTGTESSGETTPRAAPAGTVTEAAQTALSSETPVFDSAWLRKSRPDLVYCSPEGNDQKLDVYFPSKMNGKFPTAVYIHGGGWTSGDKTMFGGLALMPALLKNGYLVVSVNYRLGPQYHFPAMIEDAKCAIRFLRAHAAEFNLDPDRIGVWGDSAGGHLVSLLAAAGPEAGFDVGEYLEQSSRVQAVIDLYGPIEILELSRVGFLGDLPEQAFGAEQPDDPKLAKANPLNYLSKEMPPFLILHGDRDQMVSSQQSRMLYDRLKATGVDAELVIVEGAGHDFQANGFKSKPTHQELVEKALDFFDRNLKEKNSETTIQ